MPDISALPLIQVIALFLVAALVIGTAGVWMVTTADRLADRTGLGEAITGAVLLGIATSLSGTITSITAAADGYARLAVSNGIGGIAAQTFFLALADMLYRRANLEHAAASLTNITQCGLLLAMLSLPLLAMGLPEFHLAGIHPVSVLLVIAYLFGLRLAREVQSAPQWGAHQTSETWADIPDEPRGGRPLQSLLLRFAALAVLLAFAGFVIARTGETLAVRTGLDQTVVGALMTAVVTSMPELVTTVAAVRRRALTLAVGGIIGGNSFDVLFLSLSDIAWRDGSIYHAVGDRERFVISLAMLMAAVLLLGLLRREKHGFANIGFESVLLVLIYAAGVTGLLVFL